MLRTSKVLAGMLVAVFAIAILPVAGWANSSSQVQQAAGCHSHLPSTPAPVGPSHQCATKRTTSSFAGSPAPRMHLSPIVLQLQPR
jgi:hypothetical protein